MDNVKVGLYIKMSFAQQNNLYSGADRTNQAWSWLLAKRGSDDPTFHDTELAVAEHYMYARWAVGSGDTWLVTMIALCAMYDPYKGVKHIVQDVLGDDYDDTAASIASIKWGIRGANDGSDDKDTFENDPAAKVKFPP